VPHLYRDSPQQTLRAPPARPTGSCRAAGIASGCLWLLGCEAGGICPCIQTVDRNATSSLPLVKTARGEQRWQDASRARCAG